MNKKLINILLIKLSKYKLPLFIVAIVLISGISFYLISGFSIKNITTYRSQIANRDSTEQLDSCKGLVDVIIEENSYYVACTNGVFVIEKGKVVKKWTLSQLQISGITSVAKSGDKLYFGNFGVTSLDLSSGNVYKYSEQEKGLKLNIGDTKVVSDDKYVWVATFGDLYQIDTSTSNIKVLTNEVAGDKLGFEDIVVTPKSVFILSQGFLFRYDKETFKWDKFDKSVFGSVLGTISEAKYSQLLYVNGVIMLLQPWGPNKGSQYIYNRFWYAVDETPIKWKPFNAIMAKINDEYSIKHGYEPDILISGYHENTGSVIFYVNQYNDTTYYYANPITGEFGLARNKFGDSITDINSSDEYGEFVYRIINNY